MPGWAQCSIIMFIGINHHYNILKNKNTVISRETNKINSLKIIPVIVSIIDIFSHDNCQAIYYYITKLWETAFNVSTMM